MDGFPLELRYKPTPLVAVAGAPKDFIVAVEKATSTVTIEAQRSCPIFRFLSTSPKELIIPPRNDKDKPLDYIPEGILPAGWITALSHKIPCAILYVVEWDAHDFKAREYEHFAALDSIRYVPIFITHCSLQAFRTLHFDFSRPSPVPHS
jgi:hypothetical protein